MNAIKKICFDKFATAYNNYSIDSKTEYKYDFDYLNNHSERELLIAREQFAVLIKLLFENKPNVYLDMGLDSLLRITKNSTVYFRAYN